MNRTLLAAVLMTTAVSMSAPPARAVEVRTVTRMGLAPAPPSVVFRTEPRVVAVPNSRVFVVQDDGIDYSLFRYGSRWYLFDDGWWYRSNNWNGPYVAVATQRVPQIVMTVPAAHGNRYWQSHPHGGPPGQLKKGRVPPGHAVGKPRGKS